VHVFVKVYTLSIINEKAQQKLGLLCGFVSCSIVNLKLSFIFHVYSTLNPRG
jgi:hypothetical protein